MFVCMYAYTYICIYVCILDVWTFNGHAEDLQIDNVITTSEAAKDLGFFAIALAALLVVHSCIACEKYIQSYVYIHLYIYSHMYTYKGTV